MNKIFKLALLSDSCLTDADISAQISEADKVEHFDCAVHLGNIINGNNPEKVSDRVYGMEVEKFRNSIESKRLYVCQGETDGYRNERFLGQLATDITTDEKWTKRAEFLEENGNVKLFGKPYYYADFPDKGVRLIFLCPYISQLDEKNEIYMKFRGFDTEQLAWLINDAAKVPKGRRVLVFSHRIPDSRFEGKPDPYVYMGKSTESFLRAVQYINENGGRVAAHFAGAYGKFEDYEIGGIKRISIPSAKDGAWLSVTLGETLTVNGRNL